MPNHAPSSSTTSQIFSTYTTQSATEIHPLDAYPHFSVLTTLLTFEANGPFQAEYRVYKHRRLRSGRLIKGGGLGIADLVLMAGLGWWIWVWMLQRCWSQDECMSTRGPQWLSLVGAAALLVYLLIKSRTVLYQSVTPISALGIQLSTTRGLSLPFRCILIPLFSSCTIVPLADISTVIINEGLQSWGVKFYLAVVRRRGEGVLVAFDSVMPPFAVLLEVYHGVREVLFNEFDDTLELGVR